MSLISALRKKTQGDFCEFKDSLVYVDSSRPASQDTSSKKEEEVGDGKEREEKEEGEGEGEGEKERKMSELTSHELCHHGHFNSYPSILPALPTPQFTTTHAAG